MMPAKKFGFDFSDNKQENPFTSMKNKLTPNKQPPNKSSIKNEQNVRIAKLILDGVTKVAKVRRVNIDKWAEQINKLTKMERPELVERVATWFKHNVTDTNHYMPIIRSATSFIENYHTLKHLAYVHGTNVMKPTISEHATMIMKCLDYDLKEVDSQLSYATSTDMLIFIEECINSCKFIYDKLVELSNKLQQDIIKQEKKDKRYLILSDKNMVDYILTKLGNPKQMTIIWLLHVSNAAKKQKYALYKYSRLAALFKLLPSLDNEMLDAKMIDYLQEYTGGKAADKWFKLKNMIADM